VAHGIGNQMFLFLVLKVKVIGDNRPLPTLYFPQMHTIKILRKPFVKNSSKDHIKRPLGWIVRVLSHAPEAFKVPMEGVLV